MSIIIGDGMNLTIDLGYYEYLYIPTTNIIYINTPPSINSLETSKSDLNFCSTISEAFSSLLDVVFLRQQIRELYSKSSSDRNEIIRSEQNDINLEKLTLARKKLGIISDPKRNFWLSFVRGYSIASKITEDHDDS